MTGGQVLVATEMSWAMQNICGAHSAGSTAPVYAHTRAWIKTTRYIALCNSCHTQKLAERLGSAWKLLNGMPFPWQRNGTKMPSTRWGLSSTIGGPVALTYQAIQPTIFVTVVNIWMAVLYLCTAWCCSCTTRMEIWKIENSEGLISYNELVATKRWQAFSLKHSPPIVIRNQS